MKNVKSNSKVVRTLKRVKWLNVIKAATVATTAVLAIIVIKMAPDMIKAPLEDPAVQESYRMSHSEKADETIDYEYLAFKEKQDAQKDEDELMNKVEILDGALFCSYDIKVDNMLNNTDIVEVYAPEQYVGKTISIYNVTDDAGLGKYIGTYPCVGESTDGIEVKVNSTETYHSVANLMSNFVYIK